MSEHTIGARPPEPDFSRITTEELIAYRDAENRFRASAAARVVLGEPHSAVAIAWRKIALPGRDLPVRVYRSAPAKDAEAAVDTEAAARTGLPLVIHVHGGGFVGTAAQCDWTNSHLAAQLPALVVSVEHRLLAPGSPLADAAADGWDVLQHVLRHSAQWGADPARAAVFGESCGALISALIAMRARESGLELKAQVLVNPALDLTESMFDYPSIDEFAHTPARALPLLRFFQRLAVPPGTDAGEISPLSAHDLSGLAPALVVIPTHDAVADHGRRYAERLRAAGTSVHVSEYPGAQHAFLTLPGIEPQAAVAQAEILAFLRAALAE